MVFYRSKTLLRGGFGFTVEFPEFIKQDNAVFIKLLKHRLRKALIFFID